MDFQIFPADYHTWLFPIFFLETPLKGFPAGLPKWEPRAKTVLYLGHSPFHSGLVALVLNTRTGYVPLQYHVAFDEKFSTVEHISKVIVPVNCKNLVEENSELDVQKKLHSCKIVAS